MTAKTTKLTAEELAAIDGIRVFSERQREVLALRKRTGIGYGVTVSKGRFNIVTCAFARNAKGRPTGRADVTVIKGDLTDAEVIPALRAVH